MWARLPSCSARMVALGGYVEEQSDYGSQSQSVPKAAFEEALGNVERSGNVQRCRVRGEDVTEQYVDPDPV